jgi:hypothetical protein
MIAIPIQPIRQVSEIVQNFPHTNTSNSTRYSRAWSTKTGQNVVFTLGVEPSTSTWLTVLARPPPFCSTSAASCPPPFCSTSAAAASTSPSVFLCSSRVLSSPLSRIKFTFSLQKVNNLMFMCTKINRLTPPRALCRRILEIMQNVRVISRFFQYGYTKISFIYLVAFLLSIITPRISYILSLPLGE